MGGPPGAGGDPDELQKTLADYEAELETARRLTTLRELGASEKELASWKARFEGPGRGGDLDAQYERRTTTLHGEAEVAALREKVAALYEDDAHRQGPSQPPPPHDGDSVVADLQQRLDAIHRGDTPTSDRPEGSGTENDASLEARLEKIREGDDHTGLSREEQQQWADRHARAEDDAARQAVERQHADRMAQVERDRRLKAVSVGGPEGARRSPERQDAWQSRLDEAADDPQAVDRVLDDYDAETDTLRREGKELLEQELRAPDRLRDLDRRIDRSLDRLPEEVRTRAARDARTLVERLRDLTAVPEETPAPKTDDAVPEQSAAQDTGLLRPTPAPAPAPAPHPTPTPSPSPRPADSERDRRAPAFPGEQLMEAPRQQNVSSASEDGGSTHSRDRDDLPSPDSHRIPTETEEDALTSSASDRDDDAPHLSDDAESVTSAPENPENAQDTKDTKDTEGSGGSENSESPAKGNRESQGGDETQGAPSGDGHRPGGSSEEQQPQLSARDQTLNALSADEFEKRMYRARRDRPDLTTDEALRDEVYRRINDPGVKVEKEVSLARPLLAEGVAPPSGRSGAFVTFDDDAMLPTSLRGNGHGHITLRGVERLVDALTTRWRLHPDGAAQLNLLLSQSPHTLLGPRTLVLPTLDGGRREVTLSLDSYGNWRRFTEPTPPAVPDSAAQHAPGTGEGDSTTNTASRTEEAKTTTDAPVKVETELRTRPGATETKTLGTSRAFGLAVPIGPSGTPFGALGSVSLSGRRMEASYTYTQENRAQSSVTTVGKDGSHLHVSDLHIVAESLHVWDKKGRERPANQQQAGTADQQLYRIQDGVAWRVPDSVTDPAIPDRLPPPSRSPPAPGRTCSRR